MARKFETTLIARLGAESAAEIMSRAHTASTPYFNLPPEPIDFAAKQQMIVSASRFEGRKNVVSVAKALSLALPKMPGWVACVAGQGEDETEIRQILASLIDEGRVSVGYDATIEKTLRAARVYISLIEPDNYPSQAVLEAMHFGNALVLSDKGDSGRFIGDSGNGVLVPIDPKLVAEQLVAMSVDDESLEQMGRSSVVRVHQEFDPRVHIAEMLRLHMIEVPLELDNG
ncbi:MAG: glycosyltransferase [Leucobacter sp.]